MGGTRLLTTELGVSRLNAANRTTPDSSELDERTPRVEELTRSTSAPEAAWWRGALIGAAALALALGLLAALWLLARPLALLFAAIAIAEALSPVVEQLERKMSRGIAVVLVYAVFVLILIGAGWYWLPQLATQAQQLAENAPNHLSRLQRTINHWDPSGNERILSALRDNVTRFSDVLIELPFRLVESLLQLLLVLFMSAYWLVSAPALGRFFRSLFPSDQVEDVGRIIGDIRGSIGGYVRGEAIAASVIGIITYVGLSAIGVEYALVLAMFAFVGELVPVVGPIISAVPALAVALIQSPTQALIVLAFYVVLQQFESNILLPQVMNQTAHIPPLLSIIALFAGATVGGLLGALVAIPLAGALKVVVTSVVAPAIRRWSGREHKETRSGANS